jgi:Fe-S cluster biogenesis protein NfuA
MHGIIGRRARVSQQVERLRTYTQSHGGDVELVDVRDDTVWAPPAPATAVDVAQTLRTGSRMPCEQVPEITKIEVVPNDPTPVMLPVRCSARGAMR